MTSNLKKHAGRRNRNGKKGRKKGNGSRKARYASVQTPSPQNGEGIAGFIHYIERKLPSNKSESPLHYGRGWFVFISRLGSDVVVRFRSSRKNFVEIKFTWSLESANGSFELRDQSYTCVFGPLAVRCNGNGLEEAGDRLFAELLADVSRGAGESVVVDRVAAYEQDDLFV